MNKTYTYLFILIVSTLLLSQGCGKKDEKPICDHFPLEKSTLKDSSDYQVIGAILKEYYSDLQFIHIIQQTDTVSSDDVETIMSLLAEENIEADSSLIMEYDAENSRIDYFSDSLLIDPVTLINQMELNCMFYFTESGWDYYYSRYPDSKGILSFSRPGINDEGNKAIVEYAWYANTLAAAGYLVLLEKFNGTWTITHHLYTWIS